MKTLKFEKHTVTTRDNEDDEHDTEVVSAVVDEGTAGQEVFLRDGTARPLRSGEVVVPVGGGKHDVFTADQWDDMWNDSERVIEHGGALRSPAPKSQEDANKQAADDKEMQDFRAWKASQTSEPTDTTVADSNDVTDAPKDDVKPSSTPAKKAAASSGKRS